MIDSLLESHDQCFPATEQGIGKGKGKAQDVGPHEPPSQCYLTALPTELIDSIFEYLSAIDLNHLSETCRTLYAQATADHLWQALVQENVPGQKITSSYPCATFRELYRAHDPRWFLPKYKIWFSDTDLPGRLIVVQYDQRRGCIEGYQVVANKKSRSFTTWQANHEVVISTFDPDVKLHLDHPILRLPPYPSTDPHEPQSFGAIRTLKLRRETGSAEHGEGSGGSSGRSELVEERLEGNPFQREIPMQLGPPNNMHNNFMYARRLDPEDSAARLDSCFPYGDIWPPPAVPSSDRVLSTGLRDAAPLAPGDCPSSRRDLCDRAFRIRKWLEVRLSRSNIVPPSEIASDFHPEPLIPPNTTAGFAEPAPDPSIETPASPTAPSTHWLHPVLAVAANEGHPRVSRRPQLQISLPLGVHIGEEVATYATLDPALYTPTPDKPYRGIWVGDYSAHGCEFLWINQPDDDDDGVGEDEPDLEGVVCFDSDSDITATTAASGKSGGDDENNNSSSRSRSRSASPLSPPSASASASALPGPGRRQQKQPSRRPRRRLEAVKLTGDANVPRGEYSFVVDDLDEGGSAQVFATEPPFEGVRVVNSRGHVAGSGFIDDTYIPTKLFLISHDRLAQHWIGLGHISYYQRVDIDSLLVPK
ncbi:hypothetical protein VTK26DRAFT_94 [Humicola hyalothermophila]